MTGISDERSRPRLGGGAILPSEPQAVCSEPGPQSLTECDQDRSNPFQNGPLAQTDHRLLLILLAIAATLSFWMWHVGFRNAIFDSYSFRQTQTAISARSIEQGGPFFAYETPILGPPWSIPFEFPLYQGLAGYSARWLRASLDETGRVYSGLFFYAILIPLYFVLRRTGVPRWHCLPFFCLLLMSPFFVFWSRTFMIESCALFLSVSYLALVLAVADGMPWRSCVWLAISAAAVGALAGAVKVTTFAVFLILAATIIARGMLQGKVEKRQALWLALLTCAVPFVLTSAWTHYADSLKLRNAMAADFTSSGLRTWVFGTLRQRLAVGNYLHFWEPFARFRGGPETAPVTTIVGGPAAVLATVIALPFSRSARAFFLCLGLWLLAILIFFNLLYIHSYYSYGNGIFLILACGYVIAGLLRRGKTFWWAGICLLAFVMGSMLTEYLAAFYPTQRNNSTPYLAAATMIQKVTVPADVLLVYGQDWSSAFAYAADRRAIMDRYGPSLRDERLQVELAHLGKDRLGAVVACGSTRSQVDAALLHRLRFQTTPYSSVTECDIYLPERD